MAELSPFGVRASAGTLRAVAETGAEIPRALGAGAKVQRR